MSVWFRRTSGLDTATMREVANVADVSWSAESIVYRGNGIGFADGEADDADVLREAAETILGYRPMVIDAPPEADNDSP